MSKKIVGAIIILLFAVSIVSTAMLTFNQPKSDSNSNTITPSTSQSTNQQQLQNYIGTLVSYNYTMSKTNGVESTQLFFADKTFNYPGYTPLDIYNYYNVTYYLNNPNQALNISWIPELPRELMGEAEQGTITNVAFSGSNQILVTVQNTGTATMNFTVAYLNGVVVLIIAPTLTRTGVPEGSSQIYTLAASWMPGQTYDVKLTTTKGNNLEITVTAPSVNVTTEPPTPTEQTTIQSMEMEQGAITNIYFSGPGNAILVTVSNTGTSNMNFTNAFLNGVAITTISPVLTSTNSGVAKEQSNTYTLTATWTSGTTYDIKFTTTKGNNIETTVIAP